MKRNSAVPLDWIALDSAGRALKQSHPDISAYLLRLARDVMLNARSGKNGRPSKGVENSNRAIAYWRVRAANPEAPDAAAIKAGQGRYPNPPSAATMKRIARQCRDGALEAIEAVNVKRMPDGTLKSTRTGRSTLRLRQYLKRHAPPGRRKPP